MLNKMEAECIARQGLFTVDEVVALIREAIDILGQDFGLGNSQKLKLIALEKVMIESVDISATARLQRILESYYN